MDSAALRTCAACAFALLLVACGGGGGGSDSSGSGTTASGDAPPAAVMPDDPDGAGIPPAPSSGDGDDASELAEAQQDELQDELNREASGGDTQEAVASADPSPPDPPFSQAPPLAIVYSRIPRTTERVPWEGQLVDVSQRDLLPEVGHILSGFNAPGQLVWRKADGTEKILFDCMGQRTVGQETCVPMDPAVSFDGRKVAFSVYRGILAVEASTGRQYLGQATSAGIHVYDFEHGTLSAWSEADGVWDTAPAWLPNGRMMFTSTRANIYSPNAKGFSPYRAPALQLWIADADGRNARNVDPHDQRSALHPYVLSQGRVLYSSWQFTLTRVVAVPTHKNNWWLASTDLRGGDLHGHAHTHRTGGWKIKGANGKPKDSTLTAMHFLGERSNGDACTTMYYRNNNTGSGSIICWPTQDTQRSPLGHEGDAPFGLPNGAYIAVRGDSGDAGGPWSKFRDPMGLPDGQLLYAGSPGTHTHCYFHRSMKVAATYTARGDTCDIGIYRSARIPADDWVADHLLVVNDPHWHEFQPRPVMPYQAIYGIPHPAEPPLSNTGNDSCQFAATLGNVGDVLNVNGWQGPNKADWCSKQGCALHGVPLTEVRSMRFWAAVPQTNWFPYNQFDGTWGQQMQLLGDVPLKSDGSFRAQIPCDKPFLMAGVDAKGRAVAWHQNLMSLRPGEKQVCAGCHLHSPRDAEQPDFSKTLAALNPPFVLADLPQPTLEWNRDIYPMLQSRCASCHDGTQPPDFAGSSNDLYVALTNRGVPDGPSTKGIARAPWITRYINAFFSRESLLYWKAAGERLDGRTDAERSDDFDFGPAHPAHLSAEELATLSNWIESGSYRTLP